MLELLRHLAVTEHRKLRLALLKIRWRILFDIYPTG